MCVRERRRDREKDDGKKGKERVECGREREKVTSAWHYEIKKKKIIKKYSVPEEASTANLIEKMS